MGATELGQKIGPFEFQTKIVWFNALGFLAMHLVGFFGIYLAVCKSIFNLEILTVLWVSILVFLGGEGITMGAHRLWSHKSYKATLPMQLILITLQTLAGQNCLWVWARDHRQHHKYTDTDADPHNASRGFFFSHMGWLMMKKHPDVIAKGKDIDMSDLEANKLIMFQKRYYKPLYTVVALIIPVAVPVYFWNEDPIYSFIICFFTRYIILLNITWSVNSVAHIFGYRPYDKNMLPVESFFVSFIALGEGWHNYHHSFPWDYKCAEWGTGYNGTRFFIECCQKIGWAYDLREASQAVVDGRAQRLGDGSHIPSPQPKKEEVDDKEELSLIMDSLSREGAKQSNQTPKSAEVDEEEELKMMLKSFSGEDLVSKEDNVTEDEEEELKMILETLSGEDVNKYFPLQKTYSEVGDEEELKMILKSLRDVESNAFSESKTDSIGADDEEELRMILKSLCDSSKVSPSEMNGDAEIRVILKCLSCESEESDEEDLKVTLKNDLSLLNERRQTRMTRHA